MKANELRIGNFVFEDYGGIYKVININSEGFDYVDLQKPTFKAIGRFDFNSIKPIPLTEEILLKCGFELTDVKTHSDSRPLTKMFYKKTLLVQHHDNGLWSFIIMGYNIVRPEMSQFLHQLQNLYFALTNEELTFNNL